MSTDSFLTSLPGSDSLAKFQATFHTTPSIVSNGQSVRVDKAPFEMEPSLVQFQFPTIGGTAKTSWFKFLL